MINSSHIQPGQHLSKDTEFQPGQHWRKRAPHWDCDWLFDRYVIRGQSAKDIAIEASCTDANILYWLRKHGIARRDISDARKIKYWGSVGKDNPMYGRRGPASHRYIDGSSPERQRLYVRGEGKAFLRAIRDRDGNRCCRCSVTPDNPKMLHVHHIRPWAGNAELRFDPLNVVTLCAPCHNWVHSKKNNFREFMA